MLSIDKGIQERDEVIKVLVEALQALNELCEHYQLSPLAAACKYGDTYEPPNEEECREVYEMVQQAIAKANLGSGEDNG